MHRAETSVKALSFGQKKAGDAECIARFEKFVFDRLLLQEDHILGLQTLGPFDHFVLDLLAVFQRPEALAPDRAVVDEDIVAGTAGDKTPTLGVVKPFDRAGFALCHGTNPSSKSAAQNVRSPSNWGRHLQSKVKQELSSLAKKCKAEDKLI